MSEEETLQQWTRALEIASSSTLKNFRNMATGMWNAAFELGFNAGVDSMREHRRDQGS